jgi:hypothetical protein
MPSAAGCTVTTALARSGTRSVPAWQWSPEHDGRVTGYATGFGYMGHAVGETDDDLKALLGAAEGFIGLGFLLPSRNTALLGWCLEHGLKIVQQSALMTIGLYNEPVGAWLPSILY